jgi:hypothetical protein
VVCDTFIAGLYFLLTVHDLFTAGEQIVTTLITPDAAAHDPDHWLVECPEVVHDLAIARAALAVSPYLAAEGVNEARQNLAAHVTDDEGRLLVKDGKILTAMITPPFIRPDEEARKAQSPAHRTTPGPGHGTEAAAVRSRR